MCSRYSHQQRLFQRARPYWRTLSSGNNLRGYALRSGESIRSRLQRDKACQSTVDPWLPGEGTEIVIPNQFILPNAPKEGIVVNVPEMRLYHYLDNKEPKDGVVTYPVSIGRADWNTPEGQMTITAKALDPTWYPPESIREEHAEAGDPWIE